MKEPEDLETENIANRLHQATVENGSPALAARLPARGVGDQAFDDDDSMDPESVDPAFAELIDECECRIHAGEALDIDKLAADHPQWATQIHRLLPALLGLAALRPAQSRQSAEPAGDRGQVEPARVFGEFRILREIGRGGMGIVYEADQISLPRRVALKVLSSAATLDARAIERFQLEARVAGWLRHPGIVSVFGVGVIDGVPYYTMPFIEGGSLADLITELRGFEASPAESSPGALASGMMSGRFAPVRRGHETQRLPDAVATVTASQPPARPQLSIRSRSYVRSVVRLGMQAAEALGYAHDQGVIHRDVKPANLLLNPHGDLWVADFGMADVQGSEGLTLTGDIPGTLRYMSPEQAAGRRALVDRRTDVYSLGATLYELLTLQPAVPGTDRQEILRRIAEEEPTSIRKNVPTVPVDLATIVAKALARDPSNRYETAWDLADDLRRFQEGQPILARPVGPLARTWRWCKRKPALASLAASLLLSVIVGFVGITWAWRDAVRLRRAAQASEAAALAKAAASDAVNRFLTAKIPTHRTPGVDPEAVRAGELDVLDRAAAEVGSAFADQPEIEAEIRETIARRYHGLFAYEKSAAQYRAALKTSERLPAKATHLLRAELGHCLWHLKRFDEAEALLVPAHDAMIRDQGPTDHNTIVYGEYLASVYESQERYAEAEPLRRRLRADLKAAVGESHPKTVMAIGAVAEVLRNEKKYAEAEQIQRECLDRSRELLGPRHAVTLKSLHRLGELLQQSGRPGEAEPLLRECLEAQIQVIGSEAPDTLGTMFALSLALKARGRLDDAESLLRRCLVGLRRHPDADESDTKKAEGLLADVVNERATLSRGRNQRASGSLAPQPASRPAEKHPASSVDEAPR